MDFDSSQRERQAERERDLGDRTFTLRGETFTYVANAPFGVLQRVSEAGTDSDTQIFTLLADTVVDLIEDRDGAHERWRRVCEQTEFPVTWEDLNDLATWLITKAANRPTQAPSSSPESHGANGTPSTDTSSSTPAAASTG